jgi:hypothetical protein
VLGVFGFVFLDKNNNCVMPLIREYAVIPDLIVYF